MQTHGFSSKIKLLFLMAGQGTRWGMFSSVIPKPCLNFLNYPFIDYWFSYLRNFSIRDIYCNVYHLPEIIMKNLERYSKQYNFHISHENSLLGTAGGIKKILQLYGEDTSLVINTDVFMRIPVWRLSAFHFKNLADITLCIKPLRSNFAYTPLCIDKNQEVTFEAGKNNDAENYYFTGCSIVEPSLLSEIQSGNYADLAKDVLFKDDINRRILGYRLRSFWIDIGTPQKYLEATSSFLRYIKRRTDIEWLPKDFKQRQEIENKRKYVLLRDRSAKLTSNCLNGFVVAGKNSFVEGNVVLQNSVLFEGSVVLSGARLAQCIIGPHVTVKSHSIYENKIILSRNWLGEFNFSSSSQEDDENAVIEIK